MYLVLLSINVMSMQIDLDGRNVKSDAKGRKYSSVVDLYVTSRLPVTRTRR
jgi:hypothetical protein